VFTWGEAGGNFEGLETEQKVRKKNALKKSSKKSQPEKKNRGGGVRGREKSATKRIGLG